MALSTQTPPRGNAPASVDAESGRRRQTKEAASLLLAFRLHPRLRALGLVLLGAVLATLVLSVRALEPSRIAAETQSQVSSEIKAMNARIDEFAASCEGQGTCRTFPFERADQVAQLYALNCFNYSEQSFSGEQAARLGSVPGAGDSCGWRGTGSATPMAAVPNSSYRLSVKTPDGTANDPSLALTATTVMLAGQPDALQYVTPMVATEEGVRVAARGAFYSSPATMVIRSCPVDNVFPETEQIRQRLQSMEAGRARTPDINPEDYLTPGHSPIGTFGPSITRISVENVTVCQGADPNVKQVVAREIFSGPTPGSTFEFLIGYQLRRLDKWYVEGWGPTLDAGRL